MVKVACIQLTSGPDVKQNIVQAAELIRQAADKGAALVATPENTDLIRHPATHKISDALPEHTHEGVRLFGDLAEELNIWLLIGSMAIRAKGEDKIYNRSYLFSPNGEIAARYNKIHLFDVSLTSGETHKESDVIQGGDQAVVAQTPLGGLGMSICYDLRFAYLYRDLAQKGASILTVPAAFTVPTGRAHWEVLLRARAIETGSFVLAPAQTGTHENGRQTWGHSMIVSPWGDVLARAQDKPGIITADLHMGEVETVRRAIPALQHDRHYQVRRYETP